jgi:hypothetical protein
MCKLSLFYQLPNCNLFTQHVIYLYGETPLVNCGPRSILLNSYYCYFYSSNIYFLANKYLLPYDTLYPLFSANRWDWQPHCKLGQSILVVLCAGSTLSAGATQVYWRRAKSASNNLRELVLSPTGRLNFVFTTEGKLTDVLFTPSSWGSQLARQHRRTNKFSSTVTGEKEDFCKGSISLPIFLLCYCFAYFLYFIFACIFLSKIQKN